MNEWGRDAIVLALDKKVLYFLCSTTRCCGYKRSPCGLPKVSCPKESAGTIQVSNKSVTGGLSVKLRFKIGKLSIEDLAVDFEGNEQERRVVERMVDVVSSLPGAVMDVEATPVPPQRQIAPAAPAPPQKRRRSARRATSTNGSAAAATDGATGEPEATEKPLRNRKARGTSYYSQVAKLITDSFFDQERSEDEVNAELVRRGYNFEKWRVREALVKLTKNETLSRDQNAAGEWLYKNGPKK
jgi:hypothetical protein